MWGKDRDFELQVASLPCLALLLRAIDTEQNLLRRIDVVSDKCTSESWGINVVTTELSPISDFSVKLFRGLTPALSVECGILQFLEVDRGQCVVFVRNNHE